MVEIDETFLWEGFEVSSIEEGYQVSVLNLLSARYSSVSTLKWCQG
jgi:hypothetical protein